MTTRIGFTGTHYGMTTAQKDMLKALLGAIVLSSTGEFHHGDCIGADSEAHDIALATGWLLPVIHPPTDDKKRAWKKAERIAEPLPYLQRNKVIVNETDQLIAAPQGYREVRKSGTWATVRYARTLRRPIRIIMPSGLVKRDREGGVW